MTDLLDDVVAALGWGVGLAFNAWDVFFRRPITEADILQEVDRQRSARAR